MDRNRNAEWFPALLTAGSFLAMVSTWLLALLDGLAGSLWCALEFGVGFACALAFVSLLATQEPQVDHATIETGKK